MQEEYSMLDQFEIAMLINLQIQEADEVSFFVA
jgi:hypothetical protein